MEVRHTFLIPLLCSILALAHCLFPSNWFFHFALEVIERAVLLAPKFFDDGCSDVVNLFDSLLVAVVLVDFGEDYLPFNPAIHVYNY